MPTNTYRKIDGLEFDVPVFDYLLLKLATRCNLKCTYCYWFRDASVYEMPKILGEQVEAALMNKLEKHVMRYGLKQFSVLFHGGEPMLFGKRRFISLCENLRSIEQRTGCALQLSMTTNGVLIDEDWAALFRIFRVGITVSVDGPQAIHDRNRVDHAGRGSYEKVLRGIEYLRAAGVDTGFLAVCSPDSDPRLLLDFFVRDLKVERFDVLIPDATNDDSPPSVAEYYKVLNDEWFNKHGERQVFAFDHNGPSGWRGARRVARLRTHTNMCSPNQRSSRTLGCFEDHGVSSNRNPDQHIPAHLPGRNRRPCMA